MDYKGPVYMKRRLDSDCGFSAPRELWGGCYQNQGLDLKPQEGISWGKIHFSTHLGLMYTHIDIPSHLPRIHKPLDICTP